MAGYASRLAVVACLLIGPAPAIRPSVLDFDPGLDARLNHLASGLRLELQLCLQGPVRGDTAVANVYYPPLMIFSSPTNSTAQVCPDGTLAHWHNHPAYWPVLPSGCAPGVAPVMGAVCDGTIWRVVRDPREHCGLSKLDRLSARQTRYHFYVVQVSHAVRCWWTYGQAIADTMPLRALPGQRTWQ